MMASHQVVVVKEAQELKDFDSLIHYAEHPQPTTLLVINYKYKNPDKRKKVFKALEKNGVAFQSKKLYDNQIPGWISAPKTADIRRLSIIPWQGTPMIYSCSRLILFSRMWVTILRESQPLATMPIFSLRSLR